MLPPPAFCFFHAFFFYHLPFFVNLHVWVFGLHLLADIGFFFFFSALF